MENKITTMAFDRITQIYKELSELNILIDADRFTVDENVQIFESFQNIESCLVTLQHCIGILSH